MNLRRTCAYAARNILTPMIAPLTGRLPIRVLSPMLKAIGHQAAEPGCYIREELLAGRSRRLALLLASRNEPVANPCLLDYWQQYFWVVRNPLACALLLRLARVTGLWHDVNDYVVAFSRTARAFALQTAGADAPPLLRLKSIHERRGRETLQRLGVPADAWYVCVHCRDGGYWAEETHQNYRNASINDYVPAIRAITDRGGWVLRMGDPTMPPLPPMERVVDYARHPLRSDWMDIVLCATCKFFLGSTSGLSLVPSLFGVRCGWTNLVPFAAALPYGPRDIGIPMLMWSKPLQRHLSFPEILRSPLANARFSQCYERANVSVIHNSPEDIRELTRELLDAPPPTSDDVELQQRFHALFRPGHYSYGSQARVGQDFLRKYRGLLDDAEELPAHLDCWSGVDEGTCDARQPHCHCRAEALAGKGNQ